MAAPIVGLPPPGTRLSFPPIDCFADCASKLLPAFILVRVYLFFGIAPRPIGRFDNRFAPGNIFAVLVCDKRESVLLFEMKYLRTLMVQLIHIKIVVVDAIK